MSIIKTFQHHIAVACKDNCPGGPTCPLVGKPHWHCSCGKMSTRPSKSVGSAAALAKRHRGLRLWAGTFPRLLVILMAIVCS